jgi:DNA-binding LacI/PurR family transcriptional regulator
MRSIPAMTVLDDNRQPTLADVAERAGVSRSLASLALRGEGGVSTEKRERILRAAAELNYYPNLIARNLASPRAHSIGVVVGQILQPLQAEVAKEVDRLARAAGFDVLLSINADSDEAAEESVRALISRRVSGVILVGAPLAKTAIARVAGMIPAVYIGRLLVTVEIESVSTDDMLGARLAVEHLLGLGHRRIAHIDGGNGPGAFRRRDGFLAAMQAHGLGDLAEVVEGAYTLDAGAAAAARLLQAGADGPTAIFAANDLTAFGIIGEAQRAQRQVPRGLSVVGYGDVELAATETLSLTTIRQPARDLAAAGIESIVQRIENPTAPVVKKLVEPTLVIRRSTGAVQEA